MVKTHSLDAPVSAKQHTNILNGKSFKISPGETHSHTVKIVFTLKKHQTRLLKNWHSGKNTIIKPDMVKDIVDEVEGGSIFGKIKKAFSSDLGKAVSNALTPIASKALNDAVTARTGNPLLGQASESLLNAGAKSATGQGLKKRGRPKKGNGFMDTLKQVGTAGASALLPVVGNLASNEISKRTGNADLGNAGKTLINALGQAGLNKVKGQGVKLKVGGSFAPLGGSFAPLGGSIAMMQEMQSGTTINDAPKPGAPFDYKSASMHDRMAHLRSLRKSRK